MSNDRRKLLKALVRTDFRAFLEKVFVTLTPGQTYVPSWHIDAIAWHLEQIRLGKCKRLILNMPPRSLKSIASSVAFPAFLLGLDPSKRIICVSYSGDLAKKHANDFRAVLESNWYREFFPRTRVGPFKNSEVEIELTARGFRLATSVGGTLTGRGGDIIIIDDPLKPDDALSETKRTGANQWFTNTLLSRLDDKRTGAIVVVMQRVHIDDLTGFLTEQSDEWTIVSFPAIAYTDETIQTWNGGTHERKIGDVLSPEREPQSILEAMKQQIGSDAFSAQYQQQPAPPGGAMVKRHWVQRYQTLPPQSERRYIYQSWDTASKGGPENDWSVCTTWVAAREKRWYLADAWRGRVDYPTLKQKVVFFSKAWNAVRVLVEDTGAGTSLVQELKSKVRGIIAVQPEGDKVSRMSVASAMFEAGQVYLPERAPWLPDLESELFVFPGSKYDDQCDFISQALQDSKVYSIWTRNKDPEAFLESLRRTRRPRPYMRWY